MQRIRLEVRGNHLSCTGSDGVGGARRRLDDEALERLSDWARRYDRAVITDQTDPLPAIGRELAAWLDDGDRWLSRTLAAAVDYIALEVSVAASPCARGTALLDAPWELLAPDGEFLAGDGERPFRVERRLGTAAATPPPPGHADLALVFMAADVEGERVLNYEHEEAAVLEATKTAALNLVVEESGSLAFLAPCLDRERPEVLHLSCHGTILDGNPVLILEQPEGGRAQVSIADLRRALGEEAPKLIFLSACRTAEHGPAAAATQALVRAGVAATIGWDGSVADADATAFASTLYAELVRSGTVAYAAARARQALLAAHRADPQRRQGRHWHLARVYLGPAGGGVLCESTKPKRPFRKGHGQKEFLDQERQVPVASAAEFVGRRRQAQQVLHAFRENTAAGVLIWGIGAQGKSSLAARIANRMPHHQTVVLFAQYDALSVFEKLVAALPAAKRQEARDRWAAAVAGDPGRLYEALLDLLEGAFRCEDDRERIRPILLVVDDLERILEPPRPGDRGATPVRADDVPVLAAIIKAFRDANPTDSRLLLTSRYTFALRDERGDDLAARIAVVSLPPMDEIQQAKQMRAAGAGAAADDAGTDLRARIQKAAGGNPGLQAILTRPLLEGDANAAETAVAAIEGYRASGDVPEDAGEANAFFQRVSLQAYREMLTATQRDALRAATLFDLPVPREALDAAIAAAGVGDPAKARGRLEGLGLIDLYVNATGGTDAAVNPLARPLVAPLSEAERTDLAAAAVPPLWDAWRDRDGDPPYDQRGLALARLALMGGAEAEIVNAAAKAGSGYLYLGRHKAKDALELVEAAVAAVQQRDAAPDLHLLRRGAECAARIGETAIQDRLLQVGMEIEDGEPRARAMLLGAQADRLTTKGDLAGALRIREEEQLPVYERLGDVRERAITLGKIADILHARGDLDGALRIREEEELPAFERLGDVRSRAITLGKIADILHARGDLAGALRIREEEQLPVYERLGDVRSLLVGRANLAHMLLTRNKEGDREEARRLLDLALADARRLRLPEAQQIEAIIARADGKTEDGPPIGSFGRDPETFATTVSLPAHGLEIDERRFLALLAGSVSMSKDEKTRILSAVPRLSQEQVDELLRILEEERQKFAALPMHQKFQVDDHEAKAAREWAELEAEWAVGPGDAVATEDGA